MKRNNRLLKIYRQSTHREISYSASNFATMESTGIDIVIAPNNINALANNIPGIVNGVISPYPTVEIVWIAQYMPMGIVVNPEPFCPRSSKK